MLIQGKEYSIGQYMEVDFRCGVEGFRTMFRGKLFGVIEAGEMASLEKLLDLYRFDLTSEEQRRHLKHLKQKRAKVQRICLLKENGTTVIIPMHGGARVLK